MYKMKTPLKNLLWNQLDDYLVTCYVAYATQPIIVCSNDDPGLTMTYFICRSNFIAPGICMEKRKIMDFSETVAACDLKAIET